MLCNILYPIRKDRQSHRQILIIDDQNLTVLDFLDSCLTGTTLVPAPLKQKKNQEI